MWISTKKRGIMDDQGTGLGILIWLFVTLWNWLRKLFGGTENTSTTTFDQGTNISGEGEFAIPIQTKPADTRDLFLKMRSRSTKAGAWAGLAGAMVGLLVVGFSLEYIVDIHNNATDASGIAFIAMFIVCSGYPLIGLAAGALIGRLSLKRDGNLEDDSIVFRHGMIGGGIAGLAIGILPYLLLWVYLLRSGESLF
jgi:hypothetical protein